MTKVNPIWIFSQLRVEWQKGAEFTVQMDQVHREMKSICFLRGSVPFAEIVLLQHTIVWNASSCFIITAGISVWRTTKLASVAIAWFQYVWFPIRTKIILECPCCHQRGFKGIHGLRTHIGGYCKKQHAKDWRQHFKEFFAQLTQRLDSIPNRDISALSIIRSHRQMANAVAKFVAIPSLAYYIVWMCRRQLLQRFRWAWFWEQHDIDWLCIDFKELCHRSIKFNEVRILGYESQSDIMMGERCKCIDCISIRVVTNTQANPLPTLQRATSVTNSVSIEEMGNNYNLRRKSSLVSGSSPYFMLIIQMLQPTLQTILLLKHLVNHSLKRIIR